MSSDKWHVKLAIVGSRNYPDLEQVRAYIRLCSPRTLIITGGARGVDKTAEDEARKLGLTVHLYLPDLETFGSPRAYVERNKALIKACDRMTAFWDGKSRGTAMDLRIAEEMPRLYEFFLPGDDVRQPGRTH